MNVTYYVSLSPYSILLFVVLTLQFVVKIIKLIELACIVGIPQVDDEVLVALRWRRTPVDTATGEDMMEDD